MIEFRTPEKQKPVKTWLLYCVFFLFFLPRSNANCVLSVSNQSATVTKTVFHPNGTCDVTINFSFTTTLNTGSRYMGINITYPLNYSTPTQTSPEIAGGPKTYTITSFTGIQFNNINYGALQTNGVTASFWISTNDPSGGNVDLCETASTNFPIKNYILGLPIEFKDFVVTEQTDHASISWTTINENDVKEFNVQQKIDNGAFQNVEVVPTMVSGSNFNQQFTYKTTLTGSLDQGNEFSYRIQIIDMQGNSHYSEARMLRGKKSPSTIKMYPNPGHGQTSLIFPYNAGKANISVIDISGRVVLDLENQDNQSILIEGLKTGVYFVRVFFIKNNTTLNEKLIVAN